MTEWTKGPWDVERLERDAFNHVSGHYTILDKCLTICMGDDDENYAEVHGSTQDANARLIAAAPELYEALAEIIAICRHPTASVTILHVEKAEAILARARSAAS